MTIASVSFGAVGGIVQAMSSSDVTSEIITPSGSSQQSTGSSSQDKPIVRVASDVALYVSFGTSPNATNDATRFYFPAGSTEYFVVGSGMKVALVTA